MKNASYGVSKNVFLIISLIIILTSILALYYIVGNNIIFYMYSGVYSVLILIIDGILSVELWGKEVSTSFIEPPKKIKRIKLEHISIIILFIYPILNLYWDVFFVGPSILLMGSFSIEEFPQSIDNAGTLTFTIRETGLTYYKNYIILYKLNYGNNSLDAADNMTLVYNLEQKSKLMIGGLHDKGVWYLNINTSNLQAGNYMLHAEVTNDLSKNSTFGVFKKHDDKLFYIAPRNAT